MTMYQLAAREAPSRALQFAERWRLYHGDHPAPLKLRPDQPNDNVTVNYIRVIVDKGVSFLFGQDIRFELTELADTPAEEWLRRCWQTNNHMLTLQKLALNGAICGHAFAKIVPSQPYPRIVVLDPAHLGVAYDPDDIDQVVRYTISYPAVDPATKRPFLTRQRIERDGETWRITDLRSSDSGATWSVVADTAWPWPWPPVVDCQNLPCPNEYWGIADVESDVIALNAAINFVLSNINRIIRNHAHPKTWGTGFSPPASGWPVDEMLVFPNPDAKIANLEMTSDLQSSIALYERLREALHEVTRIPEVATGKLDRVGPLSGVALAILYQPLLEKTETKRRTYGRMLAELNRRLLAIGGFGDQNETTIHWPDLLPADPLAARQAALIDQQLGVSTDTLLQKLGYDPDLERAKRDVTAADAGEALLAAFDRGVGA
jgi:hypothetical protein